LRFVGPDELPLFLTELLENNSERTAMGSRAAETLHSQRGATQKTVEALRILLAQTKLETQTPSK